MPFDISLCTFFENESHQRKALYAVEQGKWLDPSTNAFLYNSSRHAFDPTAKLDDAYPYFTQIYDELSGYWRWWRPYSPKSCWPPETIFKTIRTEFVEFSWGGTFSLKNVPQESLLRPDLIAMRGIKPTRGYPSMPVSKFLHFYNPSLFPIYDEQWMWKKVCDRHFKRTTGSTAIWWRSASGTTGKTMRHSYRFTCVGQVI
jgi:hypothetical protein